METEKRTYKKGPRPAVADPLSLKELVRRKDMAEAAELVGYSSSAVSDYVSGKQKCPVSVDKAARFELSREDRADNSTRHAVVSVRKDKKDLFEAMMKGAEIEYVYLPGGK